MSFSPFRQAHRGFSNTDLKMTATKKLKNKIRRGEEKIKKIEN
jgi:hypothetical protein